LNHAAINHAASQAWIGFWKTCMGGVGARSLLDCDETAIEAVLAPEPAPKAVSPPTPPRAPRRHIAKLKADVLDRLDIYQTYIKRMRRWSPDHYALYRRLGAYIVRGLKHDHRELEPEALRIMPAFGAVAIGLTSSDDDVVNGERKVQGRFMTFVRLERPGHNIERVNAGVTYRCHVYWDDKKNKTLNNHQRKHGWGDDYVVNVFPDGTVRALRVLKSESQVIRHRKGGESVIKHQRWGLSDFEDNYSEGLSSAEHLRRTFISCMNMWLYSAHRSMIRVTATKDNIVMPFVVDVLETPAFFRDREQVQTADGKRRRIFHLVRAHQRRTKRGIRAIKLHFSGLKRFQWNGYDIAITVPGIDHVDFTEFNIGALEDAEDETDKITSAEMAEKIADWIGAPGKLDRPLSELDKGGWTKAHAAILPTPGEIDRMLEAG